MMRGELMMIIAMRRVYSDSDGDDDGSIQDAPDKGEVTIFLNHR